VRGRILRLLGRKDESRKELKRINGMHSAESRLWLAETWITDEPTHALDLLRKIKGDQAMNARLSILRTQCYLLNHQYEKAREAITEGTVGDSFVALLLRAVTYEKTGSIDVAIELAQALYRKDPSSPASLAMLARLAAKKGDWSSVENYYHLARTIDLEVNCEFLFQKMGVHLAWNDPTVCLREIEKGLSNNSHSGILHAERAELLRDPHICRYEEALAGYREAARLLPNRGWVHALLARALNKKNDPSSGLREFDRAVKLSPHSGWIYAWRGAARVRAGLQKEADIDFKLAEEKMPWYPFTYAWRGALKVQQKKCGTAIADLNVAIALDSTYAFSWRERYRANALTRKYEQAAIDINCAFELDPKHTWANLCGVKRACRELKQAVSLFPKNYWLKAWLGHTYLAANRPQDAIVQLEIALAQLHTEPVVMAWLGKAFITVGRNYHAMDLLQRAIKVAPKSWSVHKEMAGAYIALKRSKEAAKYLRTAVNLAPTTIPLLMELANVTIELSKYKEAMLILNKVSELDPSYAEAKICLANIFLKMKRYKDAKIEIRKALKLGGGAKAYLMRAHIRYACGDYKGQIEDFRQVLTSAPHLFSKTEKKQLLGMLSK
jgi:tetratricopeptide (TPR) repeat protein